jgi:riboflavin kinase/FMN adenylyltransferase
MTFSRELVRSVPTSGTVITIGTFDGVHLGHQHLLKCLIKESQNAGLMSMVITFRNHPRSLLRPDEPLEYITDLATRVALLEGAGVDRVVSMEFTQNLSRMKAPEFVYMLVGDLKMKGLIVGPDFALGHGREGDIPTLRRLEKEMGFWLHPIEPLMTDGEAIRSRSIRMLLGEGSVDAVHRMLGRAFSLNGVVVTGQRRGKSLGFPTANLSLDHHLALPSDGVYATWATVEGRTYASATNVGVRPTFGPGPKLVESFLMDFDGDIYGRNLTLEFVRRLRPEMIFPDVDPLIDQMKQDVEQARSVLLELGHAA